MAHILHINIRHIKNKTVQIMQYLNENTPDLVLVNETHYRPNHPNAKIYGYETIARHDNQNGTGGTAILCKNGLTTKPINTDQLDIDCCATLINLPNIGEIAVISMYYPPYQNINIRLRDFLFFTTKYQKCIFMGDFNAYHHTISVNDGVNQRGIQLNQIINHLNLMIQNPPDIPTRVNTHTGTTKTLDLAITTSNLSTHIDNCFIGDDMGSDHLPVHIMFNDNSRPQYPVNLVRNLKKANWTYFRNAIIEGLEQLDQPHTLNTQQQIDNHINKIHQLIESALEIACPLRPVRPFSFAVSPQTLALIREKRRARRLIQRDPHSLILRNAYNDLTRRVKTAVCNEKRNSWRNACSNLDYKNGPAFWKLFKRLSCTRQSQANIRLTNQLGNQTQTDHETATVFAQHLENVHQVHTGNIVDNNHKTTIDNRINQNPNLYTTQFNIIQEDGDDHPLLVPFSRADIITTLKNTKNSTPGEDKIGYSVLKQLPHIAYDHLANLYNHLRNIGYFPSIWKAAIGVMLPKPQKDPKLPTSYRPISLLRCLGKTLEKLIAKPLIQHLTHNNLLNNWQRAYLPSKEANEHVYRLCRHGQIANHYKWQGAAIFLDVEKAFDSVWQNGLRAKLTNYQLPRKLIRLLSSFLDNRTISVRVKRTISNPVNLSAGTPQGSVLSPLLFNIFVNDISFPRDSPIRISQFADDLAIWYFHACRPRMRRQTLVHRTITRHLANAIAHIENWCRTWHIKINANKSQLLYFPRPPTNPTPITLFGAHIPVCRETKFLGIRLTPNLKLLSHCKDKKEEAISRLKLLKRIRGTQWGADIPTLMHLYKTFIRPILETGYVATATASDAAKKQLKIAECKALRICNKVVYVPGHRRTTNQQLYDMTRIEPIDERINQLKRKALNRYADSPLIAQLEEDTQIIARLPQGNRPPYPYL